MPTTPPTPCGPLLTAALDNALDQGDTALTGPIVRGDVETVRGHLDEIARTAPHTLPSYVALARDTLDRVVTDGRLLPIRAEKMRQVLDRAGVAAPAPAGAGGPGATPAMSAEPVLAHTREELAALLGPARGAGRRVGFVPTMGALHDGPRRA